MAIFASRAAQRDLRFRSRNNRATTRHGLRAHVSVADETSRTRTRPRWTLPVERTVHPPRSIARRSLFALVSLCSVFGVSTTSSPSNDDDDDVRENFFRATSFAPPVLNRRWLPKRCLLSSFLLLLRSFSFSSSSSSSSKAF